MSISEFFNKKSRTVLASLALAFGIAGGYAGSQIAQNNAGAPESTYTITQLVEAGEQQEAAQQKFSSDVEQMYFPQNLPAGITASAASIDARSYTRGYFLGTIIEMQLAKSEGSDVTATAVNFVNDLRLSENLSEQDYASIVRQYNALVGVDVTAQTGNWQKGIMYQQEANAAVRFAEAFGGFFGGDDDEDVKPAERSRDIGSAMEEGQQIQDDDRLAAGLKGGAAGGFLGGLLFVPALIALRRKHPTVPQAPKA